MTDADKLRGIVKAAEQLSDARSLADLDAWRTYAAARASGDRFLRAKLRAENHEAIERGRLLEEQMQWNSNL